MALPCGFGVERGGLRAAVEDTAVKVPDGQGEHLYLLVAGAAPEDDLRKLWEVWTASYSPRPASALSRRAILRAALLGWIIPLVAARAKAFWDSSRRRWAVSPSFASIAL